MALRELVAAKSPLAGVKRQTGAPLTVVAVRVALVAEVLVLSVKVAETKVAAASGSSLNCWKAIAEALVVAAVIR